MEDVVLTIGGLIKTFTWSDLFFFIATLLLILLLIYIVYLIRQENDEETIISIEKDENKKTLSEIVDELETDYDPKPIDLSKYEQEQENTAIISYDELLKKVSNNISYEDDYDSGFDDLTVKKVDPTNTSNTQELVDLPKVIMMSYDSEEAFLKALKVLQSNLVR